jgi:hypothetical protein
MWEENEFYIVSCLSMIRRAGKCWQNSTVLLGFSLEEEIASTNQANLCQALVLL